VLVILKRRRYLLPTYQSKRAYSSAIKSNAVAYTGSERERERFWNNSHEVTDNSLLGSGAVCRDQTVKSAV